ncbi:MAG TPA: SURF1 family protein [Burkholderiales bacterium]|nr:SURF1 family protein [Burkholderiales bacterium]
MLALASWQLGRAHEKEAVRARLDHLAREPAVTLPATEIKAEDVLWRQVTVNGRFEPRYAVYLDNRVYRGIAGYHVVMPLAIGGGDRYVLVDRGWIAGSGDRSRLPQVKTPQSAVQITGLAVVPGGRFFELSTNVTEGNVWQNLTLERYRRSVPIALQPILIQQESALDDALTRDWPPPDFGIDKHYGYAFQWLALAVTVFAIYFATHVKRTRSSSDIERSVD